MHIYCITNLVNNKIYIGQHAYEDLQAYFKHCIRHAMNNSGNKTYLYRAIRKYGEDAFVCESILRVDTKEQMDEWEIFFIMLLGTQNPEIGYNIASGGSGCLGVSHPHTQEEKEKLRAAMTGRKVTWADKISIAQKGRPLTPEHIAALKVGQRGCKKPPRSLEHKQKISENKRLWWAKKKEEATNGTTG
jgi:group I intron endonuclease